MRMRKRVAVAWEMVDLFLMELTSWRWSWRVLLFGGAVAPLALMAWLHAFAHNSGPRALSYVLTGNLVLTLLFGNMDTLQSRFIYMRLNGTLDYYRTLPIRRAGLIIAVVASFLLLSLPAVAITAVLGSWLLEVPLNPNAWLLVVIPACVLPMAAIGALIGLLSPTPEAGNATRFLVAVGLLAFGPVLVPPERLSGVLVWLGWLSPTVYAASALRQTLLGPVTQRLVLDLVALALFASVGFWLVAGRLDWRRD